MSSVNQGGDFQQQNEETPQQQILIEESQDITGNMLPGSPRADRSDMQIYEIDSMQQLQSNQLDEEGSEKDLDSMGSQPTPQTLEERQQHNAKQAELFMKRELEVLGVELEITDGIQVKKQYFDPKSLYCFDYRNPLRQITIRLVYHINFDRFIIFTILINSVVLGLYDYEFRVLHEDCYDDSWNNTLEQFGAGLSIIFFLECALKVLAKGFIRHKQAYLRDPWNMLDFFVVLISISDFLPGSNSGFLKILRMGRILKPLRTINKMPRIRQLIQTLLKSISGMLNVMLFLSFILSLFCILFVLQFQGSQYQRCRMTEAPFEMDGEMIWPINYDAQWLCKTDAQCEYYLKETPHTQFFCGDIAKHDWDPALDEPQLQELIFYNLINFDNFLRAFLMLFQAITLEGWVFMMYNVSDANNPVFSAIFFLLLILIGTFFALNLVLGQIMESWGEELKEQETEKKKEEERIIEHERIQKQEKDRELKEKQDVSESPSFQDVQIIEALQIKEMELPERTSPREKKENKRERDDTIEPIRNDSSMMQAKFGSIPKIEDESVTFDGSKTPDRTPTSVKMTHTCFENLSTPNTVLTSKLKVREVNCNPSLSNESQKMEFTDPDSLRPTSMGVGIKQITPGVEFQAIQEARSSSSIAKISEKDFYQDKCLQGEEIYECKSRLRAEQNCLNSCLYSIVTAPIFNFLIFILIIFNTVVLAIDDYPQTKEKLELINVLNIFFCWIFTAEMVLKIMGLGFKNYVKDKFNLFDAIVVSISLIDWIIGTSVQDQESLGSGADVLQALKSLRMLRVIKLARTWTDLQVVMSTIVLSIKDITYYSILLLLFIYIFALLGMELFAHKCKFDDEEQLVTDIQLGIQRGDTMLSPRENFDVIYMAMTTVFIIIVGEDWPIVMSNYSRDQSSVYVFYFLVVYSFGNFILLSLFTAILLGNTDLKTEKTEQDLQLTDKKNDLSRLNTKGGSKKTCKRRFSDFTDMIQLQYIIAFGSGAKKSQFLEEVQLSTNKILPNQKNNGSASFGLESDSSLEDEISTPQKNENPDFRSDKKTTVEKINIIEQELDTERDQQNQSEMKIMESNRASKSAERQQDSRSELSQNSVGLSPISMKKVQTGKVPRKKAIIISRQNSSTGSVFEVKEKQKYSLLHMTNTLYGNDMFKQETLQKSQTLNEKGSGKALGCLRAQNPLRQCCLWLCVTEDKVFEQVIMLFICISTILLAIESPLDDPCSQKTYNMIVLDYIMTAVFTFEMLIKIIALGFISNGPESYLKLGWNILDFFIVMSSILTIAFQGIGLNVLKSLRLFRILRPLRLISRNKELKLAITSLINSIPSIINLLFIVAFFEFLMGILGTTLFKGKFYRCNTEAIYELQESAEELFSYIDYADTSSKDSCLNQGGEWINSDLNFDTIQASALTLFAIATTEGWIGVMWDSVDAVAPEKEPVRNNMKAYIVLYILIVVLNCLLFVNLFVGEVLQSFNSEKEQLLKNNELKPQERNWINVQLSAYSSEPQVKIKEDKNSNPIRNCMIKIINHKTFDAVIMLLIFANTLILGVQYYQMPQKWVDAFETVNFIFMVIFTVEAVFKIVAMKCAYFKDSWNCFDFGVVFLTLIILVVGAIPGLNLDLGAQATVIRILRIMRVLRIVHRLRKLQIILETITASLPAMTSLGCLLVLFLFLFSIIGTSFFSFVKTHNTKDGTNYHVHFQDFFSSFLTLFRCATGEAWHMIMFDISRPYSILNQCDQNATYESIYANGMVPNGCGYPYTAPTYFLIFQIMVTQIFLNLFVAIIVDSFMGQSENFKLPVKPNDFKMFIQEWKKYDPEATYFIRIEELDDFLITLSSSDCELFKSCAGSLLDSVSRENLIYRLRLPIYNGYKHYMFYDVLINLCREACQQEFNAAEIAEAKTKIRAISLLKGQKLSDELLIIKATDKVIGDKDIAFNKIVYEISNTERNLGTMRNIELMEKINDKSAEIGRKRKVMQCVDKVKQFDFTEFKKGNYDPCSEYEKKVYSSEDHISCKRIVKVYRQWRREQNEMTGMIPIRIIQNKKLRRHTVAQPIKLPAIDPKYLRRDVSVKKVSKFHVDFNRLSNDLNIKEEPQEKNGAAFDSGKFQNETHQLVDENEGSSSRQEGTSRNLQADYATTVLPTLQNALFSSREESKLHDEAEFRDHAEATELTTYKK